MELKICILILLHVIIMSSSIAASRTFNRRFHSFSQIHMTDTSRECTILNRQEKVQILRSILNDTTAIAVMPCCYDGMSAKLVESAGFPVTFMSGFAVSACYGLPDTGLLSVTEMAYQAGMICNVLKRIPCIGDGDTGYGNVANVKRTVNAYIKAGLSGIMIEDQLSPKRCGHTMGKQIVDRDEAYRRVRAAVDARAEAGEDIVILARTDARGTDSFEEAIERCKVFRSLGADWTFLEAPQSEEEMVRYCREVDGPKLANMLESGLTPIVPPSRLQEMGFTVAAYPLTLISSSAKAMQKSLTLLKEERSSEPQTLSFEELKHIVGFTDYYKEMKKYEII